MPTAKALSLHAFISHCSRHSCHWRRRTFCRSPWVTHVSASMWSTFTTTAHVNESDVCTFYRIFVDFLQAISFIVLFCSVHLFSSLSRLLAQYSHTHAIWSLLLLLVLLYHSIHLYMWMRSSAPLPLVPVIKANCLNAKNPTNSPKLKQKYPRIWVEKRFATQAMPRSIESGQQCAHRHQLCSNQMNNTKWTTLFSKFFPAIFFPSLFPRWCLKRDAFCSVFQSSYVAFFHTPIDG